MTVDPVALDSEIREVLLPSLGTLLDRLTDARATFDQELDRLVLAASDPHKSTFDRLEAAARVRLARQAMAGAEQELVATGQHMANNFMLMMTNVVVHSLATGPQSVPRLVHPAADDTHDEDPPPPLGLLADNPALPPAVHGHEPVPLLFQGRRDMFGV